MIDAKPEMVDMVKALAADNAATRAPTIAADVLFSHQLLFLLYSGLEC